MTTNTPKNNLNIVKNEFNKKTN